MKLTFLKQAVLAGLSLTVAAHAASPDAAQTTVYVNAHVFTADVNRPYAEAVAIRGNRILAVGSNAQVERAAGKSAHQVDLHGQFLMPGMIDAHAHPVLGGLTLVMASYMSESVSIPDLVKFIDQQIDAHNSYMGDTLIIHDIDLGYWSHAAEIDAILSQGRYASIPIVLNGSDGHTGWANQAARSRAGLNAEYLRGLTADKRKYFGFDGDFVPNGFVVDYGKNKVDASLPKPTPELMMAAGAAAVQYMNSMGVIGWLDAAAVGDASGAALPEDDTGVLPVYRALSQAGKLTAFVDAYPVVSPDAGLGQIKSVEKLRKAFSDVPNLKIPGLKIFADGVVEYPSQTAAMFKPYSNSGATVPPLFEQANMNRLVVEADRRGLQVHVHAIGDAAVKAALDAFALARQANPKGTLKHVITHAQFVAPADQDRFAEYRVIAALQLLWALADPSTNEEVKPYIDAAAWQTMYPARSLLEKGTEIAGASDWPVSSAAPLAAIAQAESRVGPQGVLLPDQRMPRLAMLYAYTVNAADVLNLGRETGSLVPGKRADLVLVDRDVLTVSPAELKDAKIVATMFGGKQVFGSGL